MKNKIKHLLLLLASLAVLSSFGIIQAAAASDPTVTLSGKCNYSDAYAALDLVNDLRETAGLSALTMDNTLMNAAMQRAAEISVYFNSKRPNGENYTTVASKVSAQNYAAGFNTAVSVMNGWTGANNSAYKNNMLESSYQSIGIGCFTHNGTKFWVQLFSTEKAEKAAQPADVQKAFTIAVDPAMFNNYLSLSASTGNTLSAGATVSYEVWLDTPGLSSFHAILDASSFSWSSSSSAATVNSSGVVTAVKEGSATITAKDQTGKLSASADLTVSANLNTSFTDITNTSAGIKLEWTKAPSASGYYLYRKSESGSYTLIKTIKNASRVSYQDKEVKDSNGTAYTYKIAAFSGKNTGPAAKKKTVRLTGTDLTSVANSASGKALVQWTVDDAATSYQIQYSTVKTFDSDTTIQKVSNPSKVSKVLSSLKTGSTYYVRIRTCKKVSGKTYYSAWSSRQKVKIK